MGIERRDMTRMLWISVDEVKSSVREFTVGKLLEGRNYQFRLCALNDEGEGAFAYSEVVNCQKPPERPEIPSGSLQACNVTESSVTMEWFPPYYDGGSKLLGYILEMKETQSTEWKVVTTTLETFTTIRNLKEGVKYDFRVAAENAIGKSRALLTEKPVVPMRQSETPSPPTGPLIVSEIGKHSVTLSWKAPRDDGGCKITGYLVEKLDVQWGGWAKAVRLSENEMTCILYELTEHHDYNFRVYAQNEIGLSEPLELTIPVKVKSPFEKPSSPQNLQVIELTDCTVTLEWSPPFTDGGAEISAYVTERCDAGSHMWVEVGKTMETKFVADHLIEGREYRFRVAAMNVEGAGNPARLTNPVMPRRPIELPGTPEDLDIGVITQWSVSLFWRRPVNDGGSPVTDYAIEQSLGDGIWNEIAVVEGSAHSYHVRDLLENVETFYRIRAKNAAGWGEYKELLQPIIPKKAPSRPSAPLGPICVKEINEENVTIVWQASENDGGARILGYIIEKLDKRNITWRRATRVSADVTSAYIRNLVPGDAYKFRVMAFNEVGTSLPLETESIVLPKNPIESQSALQVYQGPQASSVSVSQLQSYERSLYTHKYTQSSQTTQEYRSSQRHEYQSSQQSDHQLSHTTTTSTELPRYQYYVVEIPRYEYYTTHLYDYDTSYLSDYEKSLQHTHLHSTPLTAQVSRILREHQAIRTAYSAERDLPSRSETRVIYQTERPASVTRDSHVSRRDHQMTTQSHRVIRESVRSVQQQVTSRQVQGIRSRSTHFASRAFKDRKHIQK